MRMVVWVGKQCKLTQQKKATLFAEKINNVERKNQAKYGLRIPGFIPFRRFTAVSLQLYVFLSPFGKKKTHNHVSPQFDSGK